VRSEEIGRPAPGISRRTLLVRGGQLGTLFVAGGALAACDLGGGDDGGTAGASAGPPPGAGERIRGIPGPPAYEGGERGGTVVVAWNEGPNSLDPTLGYNPTAWDAITQLLYAPLFAFAGQSGPAAAQGAAAMPKVSDGGRTLVVKLRPGVKFHNGREVTAEDYKWSWERMLAPKTASWASSYMAAIEGAEELTAGKAKELAGVEVVDDRTLRIRLARPDSQIFNVLAEPYAAPIPREEVEERGKRFAREPVGSGPFRIESYDDGAQRAVFVRNEDYFWPGLPKIDSVEYRWGVTGNTQLQQFKAGDVTTLGLGVPGSLVAVARRDQALRDEITVIPQLAVRFISMQMKKPPFDDERVRQALNWAIDRAELEKITYGESTAWGAPFPKQIEKFERVAKPYTYDPERAKSLLAEAGHPDGFSTTLTTSTEDPYPKIAQVVQSQLEKVGVDAKIKLSSSNAFNDLNQKGQLDFALTGWFLVQPSPADLVNGLYVSDGSANYNKYANPEVDELAEKAQASFDVGEQNRVYAEIEQKLVEDAPAVFLSSFNFVAAHQSEVANFHYRGEYGIYYDRMWLTA
jgi:peptide/nickel transport system substrate-binding protein